MRTLMGQLDGAVDQAKEAAPVGVVHLVGRVGDGHDDAREDLPIHANASVRQEFRLAAKGICFLLHGLDGVPQEGPLHRDRLFAHRDSKLVELVL